MPVGFETYKIDENSHVPKRFQLRNILTGMIKSLKADEIIPSEHQMAERFKVHRLTARQAVTDLVNEGLLYRVHGSGTFVAGKKNQKTSDTVACLFRNIRPRTESDNFFLEIFEAFESELSKNGKFMLYKSLGGIKTDSDMLKVLNEMLETNPAGLVLDERVPDSVLSKIDCPDIPALILNRRSPSLNVRSVVPDSKASVSLILDHLMKFNHKRILFIYETELRGETDILNELKKSFAERGMREDALMTIPSTETKSDGQVYKDAAMRGILEHRPTAIITGFDWIAKNVYEEIYARSLKIPEDISVISVGGLDLAASLSPPLTTVRVNTAELGGMAARAALFPDKHPGDITTPVSLEERASCAKSNQ